MKLRPALLVSLLLGAACSTSGAAAVVPEAAAELPVGASIPIPLPEVESEPEVPPLSLASIFGPDKFDLGRLDAASLRVVIATGDVIPAREVNAQMLARRDFLFPWRKTADTLKSGDLLFINLEAPLIAGCPVTHTGFTFCGDERAIAGLDFAGVSVANLANNHATNYGREGTRATIALLARHDIGVCGLGLSEIREVRGIKFGFLGFNGVGTRFDREALQREIGLVQSKADVVIVAFHWGKEYETLPTSATGLAPDDPREIAHAAIDAGADLIIGNHPHWVQPVEIYRDRLITYAHGNFIFDQMWSRETRQGVVGRYTFAGTQLVRVDFLPVLIDDFAQPHFLEASTGEGFQIVERMRQASEALALKPGPGVLVQPRRAKARERL